MNIAVMSPHTAHNGNTTIASLIALELSSRNRKVCLTHTLSLSDSIFSYFNVRHIDDKTNNPILIINLIRGGGIRKNDIGNYCKPINNNLEIFSLNSGDIPEELHCITIDFICNGFPHDYVVYDMDDNDLYSKANDIILRSCDCIVYVLSQEITELTHFAAVRQEIMERIGSMPMLVVVNKFTDIAGTMKDAAASIGIRRANKWYKLNYNPWIAYGTNKGKISFIHDNMLKSEYHVVDIHNDIKLLVNGIMSVRGILRNRSTQNSQKAANNE